MNKYSISYIRDEVHQSILVEAPSSEIAKNYFMGDMTDAEICGEVRLASSDDMKPGKPVIRVPEMTHNEYQKFLEQNAARLHTESGYTMEDYTRDADSVAILDFDLSKYGLSKEYEALINAAFSTEGDSVLHNKILRGHVFDNDKVFTYANALGCECAYDNYYGGFFKNDESRLVFGFCEGDITLILCEDEKSYRAEYYRSCQFYKVEPDDVLEYDSENVDKWAEVFDIASPQECADLFGKPVRDGEVIYYPENLEGHDNKVNELIADASARSVETGNNEPGKEAVEFEKE